MAKQDIIDRLIAFRNQNPVLSGVLTSNSAVSVHRSMFALVAEVVQELENDQQAFIQEINGIFDTKQVHTLAWWRTTTLGFQLGDQLQILPNGNLAYPTVDQDARIITRSSVISSAGGLTIRVAKTPSTVPEPLSAPELEAFTAYVEDIQPAGIAPNIISVAPDEMLVRATVEVDPQVMDRSNGSLLDNSNVFPVANAIEQHIATFQNDNFGGEFFANRMLAAILDVTGVMNVTLQALTITPSGSSNPINVLTEDGRRAGTVSGYLIIDPENKLSDTITYE